MSLLQRQSGRFPLALALAMLLLALLLVPAAAAPWSNQVIRSTYITFIYPDILSDASARKLLREREEALEIASNLLGNPPLGNLIVTIDPNPLWEMGYTVPTTDGASIRFLVNPSALEAYENGGPSPFGVYSCHEEIHALANYNWSDTIVAGSCIPGALSEGLAVWMTSLHTGDDSHQRLFDLLRLTGNAYPLPLLLDSVALDPEDPYVYTNLYNAGASVVEFLITTYGWDRFIALYNYEWLVLPQFDYAPPGPAVEAVYEMTIEELEAAWQFSLQDTFSFSAEDAVLITTQMVALDNELYDPLVELLCWWEEDNRCIMGYSRQTHILSHRMSAAAMHLLYCTTDTELEQAVLRYRGLGRQLTALYERWLDAIAAYADILDWMEYNPDPEALARELTEVAAQYAAVGDFTMENRLLERAREAHP